MNFFNVGTAELLLIFAIALIVVGPRRLPQIARDFGKILNDLRKMSQEFTKDLTLELNPSSEESETGDIADQNASEKAVQEAITDLTQELDASSEESERSMTNGHLTKDHLTKDHLTNDHLTNDHLTNDHLTNDQGPSDQ